MKMARHQKLADWYYYLTTARDNLDKGKETMSWLCLLLAEDLVWKRAPSEKQVQQRKLASILWRLEGINGQLSQLYSEFVARKDHREAVSMARGRGHVNETIGTVRKMMKESTVLHKS